MPRIIAVANRKGGVGKTVTAVNLAGALVGRGLRVLCIDIDPQASLSYALGVQPMAGATLSRALAEDDVPLSALAQQSRVPDLSVVAGEATLKSVELGLGEMIGREFRLRRLLQRPPDGIDIILLDCPPSLGFLTANALMAADEVLIPVDLGSFSLQALQDTLKSIEAARQTVNYGLRTLGILINNVRPGTSYDRDAEAYLREHMAELALQTRIPSATVIDEAVEARHPVTLFAPRSVTARLYEALADEVLAREVKRVR